MISKNKRGILVLLFLFILISIIQAQTIEEYDWSDLNLEKQKQKWMSLEDDFKKQLEIWNSLKTEGKHNNEQKDQLLFEVIEKQEDRDKFLTNILKENNKLSDDFKISGITKELYKYNEGNLISRNGNTPDVNRILPIEDAKIDKRVKEIKGDIVTSGEGTNPGFKYEYGNNNVLYADQGFIDEDGKVEGTDFANGFKIDIEMDIDSGGRIYQIGLATENSDRSKWHKKIHIWEKNPNGKTTITDNEGKITHRLSEKLKKDKVYQYGSIAKIIQDNGAVGYDFSGILDNEKIVIEKPNLNIKENKVFQTIISYDENFNYNSFSSEDNVLRISEKTVEGDKIFSIDGKIDDAVISFSDKIKSRLISEKFTNPRKDTELKGNVKLITNLRGNNIIISDSEISKIAIVKRNGNTEIYLSRNDNKPNGVENERVTHNLGDSKVSISNNNNGRVEIGIHINEKDIGFIGRVRYSNTGVPFVDDVMSRIPLSDDYSITETDPRGNKREITLNDMNFGSRTHEATHLINGHISSQGHQGLYFGDGKFTKIKIPNIKRVNTDTISANIPSNLRDGRFQTYFGREVKRTRYEYEDGTITIAYEPRQALYYSNEHTAYINGARAAIESFKSDKWDGGNTDAVDGGLEFSAFQLAVSKTIKDGDSIYWSSKHGQKYRALTQRNIKMSMELYYEGIKIPAFQGNQEKFLRDFRTSDLIAHAREVYGDELANLILGN